MRKIFSNILILCLILTAPVLAWSRPATLTAPDSLSYPALHFKPPQVDRTVLPNGVVIYLLEDHELPLVKVHALIKTGGYFDPEGKEGLAELTGLLMRTGGTETMTGSQVDETLEKLAIDIDISTRMESCAVGFSSLKDNLPQGIEILAQILRRPIFAEDKLQLAKNLKLEELKRIADDPQQFAFREFNRVLYRGDPRGRLPSLPSIKNISRDDLRRFYGQYFNPDNLMLAVTGDVGKEEALAALQRYFGDWPARNIAAEIPPPAESAGGSIYFLPKDVPQSVIIAGNLAPAKNSADFYPFTVLDFLLGGGGFRSRLFQEIRTDQGLAYSVGSFYMGRSKYGVFGSYALTKSNSTGKVLALLSSLTEGFGKKPLQAAELSWAIKSINNKFIFSFSSSDQIARQQMMLEFEKLSRDYLLTYQDKISKVGSKDIERVAGRYLTAGRRLVLVLGKEKDFDQPLANFGTVERLKVEND